MDLLNDNDYEVTEVTEGMKEDFDAETAIDIVVDGEDMLPLQVLQMDPDSKNLKQAHDTGEMTMTFEGEEGQIGVLPIDDYTFIWQMATLIRRIFINY